jgi:hypothetical protein
MENTLNLNPTSASFAIDPKTNPRALGRDAIQKSVEAIDPLLWKNNWARSQELKLMIESHPLFRHPLIGLLESEDLSNEATKVIHLEFAYAFAQVFTDTIIHAMAGTSELEARLGPLGKVSARFLSQLNLMDELGFCPAPVLNDDYYGSPYHAHYAEFAKTMEQLGVPGMDIYKYSHSEAAEKSRRSFTDQFNDYLLCSSVLACAEQVFTQFAGPWAKSVGKSTNINVSQGYHKIHVEDEAGDFLDDKHSEDTWYLFSQALTENRFEEVKANMENWLDCWNDFCDHIMHVARKLSPKKKPALN